MLSTRALAARAHLAAAYQSVLSLHFHKTTFKGYTRNKMGPQVLSPVYSLGETEPWIEDVRGSREHRSDSGWTPEAHTAPGGPSSAGAALRAPARPAQGRPKRGPQERGRTPERRPPGTVCGSSPTKPQGSPSTALP